MNNSGFLPDAPCVRMELQWLGKKLSAAVMLQAEAVMAEAEPMMQRAVASFNFEKAIRDAVDRELHNAITEAVRYAVGQLPRRDLQIVLTEALQEKLYPGLRKGKKRNADAEIRDG
jgi:hypothetical protein